jgi:fructose-bisphosphate aldolase, class II
VDSEIGADTKSETTLRQLESLDSGRFYGVISQKRTYGQTRDHFSGLGGQKFAASRIDDCTRIRFIRTQTGRDFDTRKSHHAGKAARTLIRKSLSLIARVATGLQIVFGGKKPMKQLIEVVDEAGRNSVAIGHFNIADLVLLKGIFEAARELKVPVMVGASEGEREFAGTRQLAAAVRSLRDEFDFPIFLNADHTHSLARAMEAVKAGFDSVVFDLSALPIEENALSTKQAVEALKSLNPAVIVEGEIGDIGSGSEIHPDGPSRDRALTTPEEARQFVRETKVDVLAPAVGNSHGMRRSMVAGKERKHLAVERIREIKSATGIPLTLHGGSGTADEDLKQAIRAGINIVHINTEVRLAWKQGLEAGLARGQDEIVPYKILPTAVAAIHDVVSARLRLFGGKN